MFLTHFPNLDVSYARSMLVFSPYHSNRHTPPASDRPELTFHIYLYNSNLIRSAGSRQVYRHQLQIKRDAERWLCCSDPRLSTRRNKHFGSSYCNNDKFIIYPFPVIEKVWNKYLGSTVQRLFTKEKYISKKNYRNFYKPWAKSWLKNRFECIRKIRLCLGVEVVSFILKQIK